MSYEDEEQSIIDDETLTKKERDRALRELRYDTMDHDEFYHVGQD